jgi:mannose-6-phosphate isomerase
MDAKIYPLTFTPVLRDYLWGGRRLETLYGRALPPGITAESWEISGHPAGATEADAGYWQGQALPAILDDLGERLVGTRARWALERHKFPLLVKLLDANEDLSVQVHPDDAYAQEHEDGELGKTEMWYVLHADPGAEIILGVRPGLDRRTFRQAVETGRLDAVLRRLPLRAGQAVGVPAGTVHALLAGLVVTEIQQNSDTTYRVYDWGRVGADGKPRPLHVEKALDVIDLQGPPARIAQPQMLNEFGGVLQMELVSSPYFVVEEVRLDQGAGYIGECDGSTLEIWGCMSGEARIEWGDAAVALPAIRYALLPAALGSFRVVGQQASTCLRVYLPK